MNGDCTNSWATKYNFITTTSPPSPYILDTRLGGLFLLCCNTYNWQAVNEQERKKTFFIDFRTRNCAGDFVLNCRGRGKANQFDNCEELPDGTVPDNVVGKDDNGNGGGNRGSGGFQRSSTPPDNDIRYGTTRVKPSYC